MFFILIDNKFFEKVVYDVYFYIFVINIMLYLYLSYLVIMFFKLIS